MALAASMQKAALEAAVSMQLALEEVVAVSMEAGAPSPELVAALGHPWAQAGAVALMALPLREAWEAALSQAPLL